MLPDRAGAPPSFALGKVQAATEPLTQLHPVMNLQGGTMPHRLLGPAFSFGRTTLPRIFSVARKIHGPVTPTWIEGGQTYPNPSQSASDQPVQQFRGDLLDNAGPFAAICAHQR